MNDRRYPLALAALKKRSKPWQELSLQLKELDSLLSAELKVGQGILAGIDVEISPVEIVFKNASASQERLLARRLDGLAKRTGRRVRFG
ncbi:MAG: hypothetical protein OSB21_09670 [Myxococcota bacterium]|nr:hypothetical protein [Myxococcota bacterium]